MNVVMFVYAFVLFFVLTPGILLSLPPRGSKMVVAATHALVFALVFVFTHKIVKKFSGSMEGATGEAMSLLEGAGGMGGTDQTDGPDGEEDEEE